MCSLSNDQGSADANIKVVVLPQPIMVHIPKKKFMAVENQTNLTIPCDVSPFPRPNITLTWFFNDLEIDLNSIEYKVTIRSFIHPR